MGHLSYDELGNDASVNVGPTVKRGDFQNFAGVYWSSTELFGDINAYGFNSNAGLQGGFGKRFPQNAMVVREGDVHAIPEPQTWALLLLGLGLAALRKRLC
jgi:hypothetical protein